MMRASKAARAWAAAAVVLGAGASAAAVVLIADGGSADTATAAAVGSTSTATTTIRRQDLVEIDTEDGTLGYAGSRSVSNRLPGTVTWLPRAGRVIRPDRALYKVDDSPVILMDGRVPAYRALGPSTPDGADVRQLERSLRAAGYDPERELTLDRSWDVATTAAVKRWQEAHGLVQSGAIELGRVVFLPGRRRVATLGATVGAQPISPGPEGGPSGEAFMTTTSTRRQVTVALDTTKSALANKGARVTVVLPSEKKVRGRISSVGKVATAPPAQDPSAGASSDTEATIDVKIRLLSRRTALDRAPVTVRFERSRRKDVLAIPVTALLAQPGGRFAVQLAPASRTRRILTVRPGLYTSGYVEIAGAGVRPGQHVTNAAVR